VGHCPDIAIRHLRRCAFYFLIEGCFCVRDVDWTRRDSVVMRGLRNRSHRFYSDLAKTRDDAAARIVKFKGEPIGDITWHARRSQASSC